MVTRHATLRLFTVLLGALILGGAALTAQDEGEGDPTKTAPLSELLERAIFAEESLGDLDRAIEIYEEILGRGRDERSYLAQAQMRLARCYLKKGRTEDGVRALRSLVEEFPNQSELVAEARERLTELGHAPASPVATDVSVRRVWSTGEASFLGSTAPDGSFLSARHRGELAIHDLTTGEAHVLTRTRRGYGARESVISPDGRRIAYSWWVGELSELRLIGIDGAGERVLLGGNRRHVRPAAWSSSGDRVLAQWRLHDGAVVIAMVAVVDGAVDVLATLAEGSVQGLSLSPDDRYVVYDHVGEAGPPDLFIVDVEVKAPIPLVTHGAADSRPLWTPDGRGVLFVSDRAGSPGAWIVAVADGRPIGEPTLLKPNLGSALPLGFSRAGSFYYGLRQPQDDVFVATIDQELGRVTLTPEALLDRFVGRNNAPAWSPDGTRLAYLSRREPRRGSSWALIVRTLGSGEEREWTLELGEVDDAYQPRWSPDGHRVLVTGSDLHGRQGFYTVHLGTGDVAPLVRAGPEEFLEEPAWSPDGRTLFFSRERGTSDEIVAKDLDTGEERVLRRNEGSAWGFPSLALSRDGRWLAFIASELRRDRVEIESNGLYVMPAAGGEARELLRRKAPETLSGGVGLAWTADGRELLFGTEAGPGEAGRRKLWRIQVDGGEPSPLAVALESLRNLSLHPDGRQMAFAAGGHRTEVWVMENFLLDVVASR